MTTTIYAALVAAQAEFPDVTKAKTANTGSYSYRYADLADVLDAVKPVLKAHGLAVVQDAVTEDRGIGVTTIVIHESGEALKFGPLVLPYGNSLQQRSRTQATLEAQAAGSAITYARRYALVAALGLATDHDHGAPAAQAARQGAPEARQRPADPQGGTEPRWPEDGGSEPEYVRALSAYIGKGVGYVLTVARKVAESNGIESPKSAKQITPALAVLTAEKMNVAPEEIGLGGLPAEA